MSNLTYNLQIDSKFRDIEKYPNPCDFGVTFVNTNTGTSVLGQPLDKSLLYAPVQIDPDYLDSDIQITNSEIFSFVQSDDYIFLSGIVDNSDHFNINYVPQPKLVLPNSLISGTGYQIASLTGLNILNTPFVTVLKRGEDKLSLHWMAYLSQLTGTSSSGITNKSSRSTFRLSPSNQDILFWAFDFSTSITVTQLINSTTQEIHKIQEPSNGNVALLINGFNVSDGSTYKYEAREWGYELVYSDFSIEKTKDNGRFNINVDEVNNVYLSGNTTTFSPSYNYVKYPFSSTEQNATNNSNLTDSLKYYMTGSNGLVDYVFVNPWNMENTLGIGSTGSSFLTFNMINSSGSLSYLGKYIIDKDPGAIYQQVGYKRYEFLRVKQKSYFIFAPIDSTRSHVSYQNRIYEINPTGATGSLVCRFSTGPNFTNYTSGITSTVYGTDIYTFQRCGITTGPTGAYSITGGSLSNKFLLHKFDTLTNIGQTLFYTGPIIGLTTGTDNPITNPLTRGGLQASVNDSITSITVGSDIYFILFDSNAAAGTTLVMPIIVIKYNVSTNLITQYGNVLSKGPPWPQFRGIINYKNGKKIIEVSTNSNDTLTHFYDATDIPTIKYITSINNNGAMVHPFNYVGDNLFGVTSPICTNWNMTDINNLKKSGVQYQVGDNLIDFIRAIDNQNCIVGIGGSDINGWYLYRTQPIISNNVTIKQKYVTKNTGQYIRTGNQEFTNQVSYTPKEYTNPNIQNFEQKLFLISVNNQSLLVDDVSNISYTIPRIQVDLSIFGFQNHPNRPNGLWATRANTYVFDHSSGIYFLFGFYNKIGLYYYNDALNTMIELSAEIINLGGVVYVSKYSYNGNEYAVFVFINNAVRIYQIVKNLSGTPLQLQFVSQTAPASGSFNFTAGAILVYYTLTNKYYLHLLGYASIILINAPRRLISIEITDPLNPVPTPSSNAYTIALNISTSSNGLSYFEDEEFNVVLYLVQQTRTAVLDITNPTVYDEVGILSKQGIQASFLQTGQSFYNKIDKTRYLVVPYYLSNIYLPNPIYLYKIDSIYNPILDSSNVTLQDNYNQNPVLNITICQNENKTYASFLYANYRYSTGPSGAYTGAAPTLGTTGAIGVDISRNYLYFIYDLSNVRFAGYNQNPSTTISNYPYLPINGSSFITKFNADGTNGWLSFIGSNASDDDGQFTNLSNFTFDKSKRYIYAVGGWENSVAFYQTSSQISSASGVFNYFRSQNTVYNSFLSKMNIFTGQWIWALPLIGNLDDFTERLSYQFYNNTEVLLMSVFFNSFSLQAYQAINSSLNPSSILNNIINITNNTSSVSSAIYAFTPLGAISWSIILFSKTPLTNVYVLDVDSTDGIITVIGVADTTELYCQDSSGAEVQVTYSNIDSTTQQYIFIYRFNYLGVYISSQKIEFPASLAYLTINDIKTYTSSNKFILPIVFKTIAQDSFRAFNKDGTFAQDIQEYTPFIKNTILVSYKNNSQYVDPNGKVYTSLKYAYTGGLENIPSQLTNYYNYIIGNEGDQVLNKSFQIRDSLNTTEDFRTILNQYIDTSKLNRRFVDYSNTGQFIRPDLSFYRVNVSKTPTNGYLIYDSINGITGEIKIDYKNFTSGNSTYVTVVNSGAFENIPVTYYSSGGVQYFLFDPVKYQVQGENDPYLLVNNKNESAYYTYQFYPGSLYKSNYFTIKKLTMTIPNRLIRNVSDGGTRDLNDLPYIYLKIFNQNDQGAIDINNFNLVYDNNVNTGTSACFQFPISYAGTTSNFQTFTLDIQPRVKFSFEYYNMRFQLIDPQGEIIQFDPTPYKASDAQYTGSTVPSNLLNITVRMQISIS